MRPEDVALYERQGPVWWTSGNFIARGLRALVRPRMEWFRQVAGPWTGHRVLDVGCGGGFMSEAIAREGANVIGVDPAVAAIRAARGHAAALGLPIGYEVGLAEALPLPDRSVDRVVCVDVLEHVDDLGRACTEMARVLEPGGMLLFDTVNRTALSRWILVDVSERLLHLLPRGTHDPRKFIRPSELRDHFQAAGFVCGSFAGLGPVGFSLRGDPIFARWPSLAFSYLGSAVRGR